MVSLGLKTEVRRWENSFFWLLLGYFLAKAVYFALSIRRHVFPDEASWFGIVRVFSRSYLLPADSPESYPLGLVSHIPNLYFLVMGKLLTLNFFGLDDLIFMRLINVGLGGLSVYFGWRLICLLLPNAGGRLLALVMLTNTMMFSFMFGAVNYDNLSTLLAVLALYTFVLWQQRRKVGTILWLLLILLAGTITKNVFLPFAFGLFLVLLLTLIRDKSSLPGFREAVRLLTPWDYGKLLVVLLLLAANINLYLGNKIHYGRLLPAMDQVLSVDDSMQNRLYARGYVVREFKGGRLSLLAAQRMALQIRAPGDRADAMLMLRKASQEKKSKNTARVGRLAYLPEWGSLMSARLYGVAAHLALYKSSAWLWGYYGIFLLGSAMLGYRFFRDGFAGLGGMLFVFSFYTIILMQVVNYGGYGGSGLMGLALTGRYIFPVILPFYLLLGHGLMAKMPPWWQWGLGGAVSGFFIYSEFPWFIQNAAANWYLS